MGLDISQVDRLRYSYAKLTAQVIRLSSGTMSRIVDRLVHLFYVHLFLFPVIIVVMGIGLCLGKRRKRLHAWLLKVYFRHLFDRKGIYTIFRSPPIDMPPGSLILTVRSDIRLAPLYNYSIFSTPLIIPTSSHLRRYKGTLLPIPVMGYLMKRVSYPDGPLIYNQRIIKELLRLGYSVVVAINPDRASLSTQDTLFIDPYIKSLISASKATFLLQANNLAFLPASSRMAPVVVEVECVPLSSIVTQDDAELFSAHNCNRIGSYFKFSKGVLYDKTIH